eukprot:TRINITY_DN10464_c0_g1_i1.p1 TRINITY_DN10464_c0_g1~~TRINITY_DN10464_c0_g1_i1.p1  ORF type:complete len:1167 (+),score=185.02 TRINITY_DN10464_c0_g1_i1:1670-5170(+)
MPRCLSLLLHVIGAFAIANGIDPHLIRCLRDPSDLSAACTADLLHVPPCLGSFAVGDRAITSLASCQDGGPEIVSKALLLQGLTQMQVDNFANLSQVDSLRVLAGNIDTLDWLQSFDELSQLDIEHLLLGTIEAGALMHLTALKEVSLFRNYLFSLPSDAFASLKHLSELRLAGNYLDSFATNIFRHNSALAKMDLSANRISEVPAALQQLTNLQAIDLSVNYLTSCERLPEVIVLNISRNYLEGVTSSCFTAPEALVELQASSNRLEHVDSAWFTTTSALVALDLSHNRLSNLDISAGRPLWPNLRELALTHNRLAAIPAAFLTTATALRALSLGYNKLRALDADLLQTQSKLQSLNLDGNNLDSFPIGFTRSLTQLVQLSVTKNIINSLSPNFAAGLSRLQLLDLANNQLKEASFVAQLPALTALDLSCNKLTAVPSKLMRAVPKLEALDISINQLQAVSLDCSSLTTNLLNLNLAQNPLQSVQGVMDGCLALRRVNVSHLPHVHLQLDTIEHLRNLTHFDALGTLIAPAAAGWLFAQSSLSALLLGPGLCTDDDVLDVTTPANLLYLEIKGSSCRSIRIRSTSLANLQITFNPNLESVSVNGLARIDSVSLAHNPRLTAWQGPPCDTFDMSMSQLPYTRDLCVTHGQSSLEAVGMLAPRSYELHVNELMEQCWLPLSRLDLSNNNWLNNLNLLQKAVGRPFLVTSEDWACKQFSHDSECLEVTGNITVLGLNNLPVQCRLQMDRELLYHSPLQPDSTLTPVYQYDCQCSPGYQQDKNGICKAIQPFLATSGGVATVVICTLIGSLLIVAASRQLYKEHRRMKYSLKSTEQDLELQRRLLAHREQEVDQLKQAWKIDEEELRLIERIDTESQGAFGEVWRAEWSALHGQVAVKILKAAVVNMDDQTRDEFEREAEFLQRTRHPNVVRFFGCGELASGMPFIVMELIQHGSLRTFIRGKRGQSSPPHRPWDVRLKLLEDVASGMAFLHSHGCLHRDLKSANILIGRAQSAPFLVAQVSDFGTLHDTIADRSSRKGHDNGHEGGNIGQSMTAGVGTPMYMAPEALAGNEYDKPADVFSCGVMMYEVASQRRPDLWEAVYPLKPLRGPIRGKLLELLESGARLPVDKLDCCNAFKECVRQCFQAPEDRPTFEELKTMLHDIRQSLVK